MTSRCFTVLLTALAAAPLAAQQPEPRRDSMTLDPVVVTAARVAETASTASATVTVLRGADLRERGISSLVDALREVPGLAVVPTGPVGATASLFMRGGNSNFVKVLVDGVPLNEAGGSFNFANLRVTNVDRIEVVRGPASVLYGSDAVAGVIQIFTTRGNRVARTVNVRGGSRETAEASVELSGGRAMRWSAGASHLGTRGIYDLNNRYRNDDVSVAVAGEPLTQADARLTARFQDSRYHYPTTGSGAPTDSNAYTAERRGIVGADVSRTLNSWLRANVSAGWNGLRRVTDNSPNSPGDTLGFYSRSEATTSRAVVDGRVNAVRGGVGEITVGAERSWQREENISSSRFASFPASDTSFDQSRGTTAAFAQAVISPHPTLRLTAGARIDDNSRFGTFDTWRASISFVPVARVTLRSAAGTAFREPAFSETFSTAFTTGDPALEPERTRSVEGGLSVRPADWLRLSGTAFAQQFANLIQYVGRMNPAEPDYENLASAEARGVEVEGELSYDVAYATAGVTRLRTRVTSPGTGAGGTFVHGMPLLRRPSRSAHVTLGVRGRQSVSVTALYTGVRTDRDFGTFPSTPVLLDAFTRVDAAASTELPMGQARRPAVTLRVENVGNVSYEHVYGFRTPGRTVLAGVRVDW